MIYHCQPTGHTGAGGVRILRSSSSKVVVYDSQTDEPLLLAPLPDEYLDVPEARLLPRGVLFKLFPGRRWAIGGENSLDCLITALNRTSGRTWGTLCVAGYEQRWTGELVHRPAGRIWQYDIIGWPTATHRLDVVMFGRILQAIHGLQASGAVSASPTIANVFAAPLPFAGDLGFEIAGGSPWRKYVQRAGAL